MPTIGKFGSEKKQEDPGADPLVFEWFGVPIRITPQFSQIRLVNLMEAARSVDEQDPMSLVIVKDMFRALLFSGDFNTFWKICEQEGQSLEELVALFEALYEVLTGRPIRRLSDSSPGQPETSESSPADSPTQASRGRPDLQTIVDSAEETRRKFQEALLNR